MDIRHAAYVKTPIVLAYCPVKNETFREGLSISSSITSQITLLVPSLSVLFREIQNIGMELRTRFLGNWGITCLDLTLNWASCRLMVLEVGRFMTEKSLYFIEANIFRGLSQLSRKTQLCVRAAWTGQSLVFWVLCFLWKCIKKTGHTISQSLEQGVFLVQKPLKADVRVDKSSSFFLLARGARRRIFLFFPGYA